MFCKLNKDYCLRGWKNYKYAISSINNGSRPIAISEKQFEILSSFFEMPSDDDFFTKLFLSGIIEECSANSDIYDYQKYFDYGNLYFDNVIFSITGKCNYKCRHCSVNAPNTSVRDLSFEELENIIIQIKDCGLKNIVLIGGEPLVRPDLLRIVDRITEEGMFISSIYTNGSLITDALLDEFDARGIHPAFQISYDGYGFHDKMRGVNGAEDNFFKVVSLLAKRNYNAVCYMSVTKESIVSLENTVRILSYYGVKALTVFPPFDCGKWQDVPDNEKLSFKEVLEAYIEYIPKYIKAGFPIDLNLYRIIYFNAQKRKYKLIPKSAVLLKDFQNSPACRTFGTELNISPSGIISPCYAIMESDFVKNNMPNILKDPLKASITNSLFTKCIELKSIDIFETNEKCGHCSYKLECGGGCRSSALLAENSFFAADPVMCYTFENGYYEKLKQAVLDGYEQIGSK